MVLRWHCVESSAFEHSAAPAIASVNQTAKEAEEKTRGPEKAKSKVKNGVEGWVFNDKKG